MLLLLVGTACSPGGRPVASDTYLPPRSSMGVTGTTDGPAPAASATDSPLPPVRPVTPALQAVSTTGFTPEQAQAVRGVPGITAVARVTIGLITADVAGGARQLSVAAQEAPGLGAQQLLVIVGPQTVAAQ